MAWAVKAGGVWLAICVIVWLTTIWRWQNDAHDASHAEIIGQLFVLPAVLAAALLAALWAFKRLRDKAGAPAALAGGLAGAASTGEAQAELSDEALRRATAWVLAEAVHLPAGEDAQGAWAALRTGKVRPSLDMALLDMEGAPVMASRVDTLELASASSDPGAGEAAASDESADWSLSAQRGLALLASPLAQLLSVIGELARPDSAQASDPASAAENVPAASGVTMKAHLSGVGTPVPAAVQHAREAMAPQLTVRVLLPAHWRDAEREGVIQALRRQSGALLDWAQAVHAQGVVWRTDVLPHPEAFWDELDQTLAQWSRQARPELLLVLAVDSALDEASIERMQAVGELFTATHQTGRMPGEGAAGLLIASASWPGMGDVVNAGDAGDAGVLPQRPLRMWRPLRARRDKSADAAGRVGITALHALLDHAVGLCQAGAQSLVVVADADHRASRGAELYESLQEALPGLDPMLAVARVGDACGELGMARAIVPTALACAALRAGDPPAEHALAVHLQSSHDRAVVALAPWMAPAAEPA